MGCSLINIESGRGRGLDGRIRTGGTGGGGWVRWTTPRLRKTFKPMSMDRTGGRGLEGRLSGLGRSESWGLIERELWPNDAN